MAERKTPEQQLATLEAKAARLRERIGKRKRALDTREKIVVGGAVIVAMRDDPELRGRVVGLLRQNVTRPQDKEAVAEWLTST